MKSETCQLQFEGCRSQTMVMFEVAPLTGKGPSRKCCSACWSALTSRARSGPEAPRKHETKLPSIPQRQRSMIK